MSKKEEILEAAAYLFSKYGYSTSMSDIASRVGIKTPSIYSHYEGKDQIIYLVIEKELKNYFIHLNQIVDSLDQKSTKEKLEAFLFGAFDYFKTIDRLRFKRNIALIDNEELRLKCRDFIHDQELECSLRVKLIFKQGVELGEIRDDRDGSIMNLYFAMLQGTLDAMLMYWDYPINMQTYIMSIWKAFWNGIKTEPEN